MLKKLKYTAIAILTFIAMLGNTMVSAQSQQTWETPPGMTLYQNIAAFSYTDNGQLFLCVYDTTKTPSGLQLGNCFSGNAVIEALKDPETYRQREERLNLNEERGTKKWTPPPANGTEQSI